MTSSRAPRRPAAIVPVGLRPAVVLSIASVAGLAMFLWPLLLVPPDEFSHDSDAPFLFALILPVLLAVVLAELQSGGIDTKALAMLGVLSAMGAALRPMGAGVAGIETVFFLLVLAGRVYGPGFGFVLGNTTLFASALLTGGIGPWLPFQMLASGWVGLGAGLLPRARGRAEIVMLAGFGVVAAYAFGFCMNMWFWPFSLGEGTELSYVAGDAVLANLHRFVLVHRRRPRRWAGTPAGRSPTPLRSWSSARRCCSHCGERHVAPAFDAPVAFRAPSAAAHPAARAGTAPGRTSP